MYKIIFLVAFISLFGVSGQFATVDAQSEPAAAQATGSQPLVLPLVYRTPGARALLIALGAADADPLKKVLLENKIKVDRREVVDLQRKDYSEYHLIIGTNNVMDGYGYEQNPADFDPMERFVAEGGHLLLFGTFNGRNSANLLRFGIATSTAHGHEFRRIPGRSELLFKGFESIMPKEDKMTSAGNFAVSTPHVVLLKRGASDSEPEQPAIATLAYKKGRVTFTQVEPTWQGDDWLLPVMATWAVRGGPTSAEQLGQNVVLDERTLIERRKLLVPSDSELQAAQQALREKFKDDIASAFTPEDKLKLATRLVEMSQTEISPAVAFAGLQLSREFYAESSNPICVYAAIRQLQAQFQYDTSDLAVETAKSLAEKAQDPVSAVELVKVCLDLADDLTASGRYDAAVSIIDLAKNAAQIAKHKHYQSMVTSLTRRLGVLQKEFQLIQSFRDTLKKTPDSPEANLEVGKFQCLIVRDWQTGLPQLALGNDEALRQLAEGELKKTDDPTAQAILADLWAAQAKKLPAAMRPAAGSRAKLWYWRAISKSTGTQRTTLEKKAAKILTTKSELRFSISKSEQSQLVISPGRLTWKSSTPPTSIEVNSQYWPIETMSELRNFGATRYMSEEVNLETATLTPVRVRGKIKLNSASPEEVVIDIDTHDDSEFVIKFGP